MRAPEQNISAAGGQRSSGLWLGIFLTLLGAAVAGYSIFLALALHSPVLLFDEWLALARYVDYLEGKRTLLSILWEDHFGHRPVLSRLAFLADMWLASGTQRIGQVVSVAAILTLPIMLAGGLFTQHHVRPGLGLLGLGIALLLLMPTQQVWNLSVGWNNALFLVVLLAVSAFATLFVAAHRGERGEAAGALLAVSILLCLLASISMSNGLLAWIICTLACIVLRRNGWALLFGGLGVLFIALYLLDLPQSSHALQALKDPRSSVRWFFAFLGNSIYINIPPFGTLTPIVMGAAAALVVAFHLLRSLRCATSTRLIELYFLAICLFVIGTAFLVSLGRARMGEDALDPVHFRYYTFVAPLWVSATLLSIVRVIGWRERHPGPALKIADSGAFVFCFFVCAAIFITGPDARWLAKHMYTAPERGGTALIAGARDISLLHLYPFDDVDPLRLTPFLAARKQSIFVSQSDRALYDLWRSAMSRPLPVSTARDGGWCASTIGSPARITFADAPGGPAFYIIEADVADRGHRMPDGLLFTDSQDRLIGIGRPVSLGYSWLAESADRAAYFGFFRTDAEQTVTAYAMSRSREDLCKVGEVTTRDPRADE